MNLFEQYNLINYIINKEQTGSTFTTDEYNRVVNYNSMKLFKKRIGLPQEYQLQTSYVQQGYAETTRILVDLEDFVQSNTLTYSSGSVNVPDKMLYPISMIYKRRDNTCDSGWDNREAELVNHGELAMRLGSKLKEPSFKYPIYSIKGNIITTEPNLSSTLFTYLREPNSALLATTTNETTGEEEYDEANSVELEWNEMAKLDIMEMILFDVGINLRAAEISQAAQQLNMQ